MKYPKTIGGCVDRLFRLRQVRIAYQRETEGKLKKLKGDEQEMEDHILETFEKGRLEGGKGKLANASISRSAVPTIDDHDAFLKHVFKTKEYDLLTKAVRKEAVRERWEHGKEVPGIGRFTKVSLSLTKAKPRG